MQTSSFAHAPHGRALLSFRSAQHTPANDGWRVVVMNADVQPKPGQSGAGIAGQ
jgi:hypothetical protein